MKTATFPRIAAFAAAAALTTSLAACSAGGQSVSEACRIAQEEISKATSSVTSDLSSSMQKATQGEKVDFNALLAPALEGIEAAEKKIANEKVKAPLTAFGEEYRNFVKVFDGFEIPDLKSLDPTDPTAMAKITAAQEKAQEIATKGQEATTKLNEQAKKLQAACTAG